ncbi:MAG: energy-coupling factor transporter transmembrane protein EcfT [Sulfuritalea sp.]|nr:energy-coupling factor transporter transmembrane protein EcfT [Sulfuritalea sp.]
MTRPHPASLILFGLTVLFAASSRNGMSLFASCFILALVASLVAKDHLRALLRRSRWLMLTMLIMFGWFTPGTPLSFLSGASQEGLLLAVASIARLIIALAAVAMLLKTLSSAELVVGMRALLAPLVLIGLSRDSVAVRLALTLQEVESSKSAASEELDRPHSLSLPDLSAGTSDVVTAVVAVVLACIALLA